MLRSTLCASTGLPCWPARDIPRSVWSVLRRQSSFAPRLSWRTCLGYPPSSSPLKQASVQESRGRQGVAPLRAPARKRFDLHHSAITSNDSPAHSASIDQHIKRTYYIALCWSWSVRVGQAE